MRQLDSRMVAGKPLDLIFYDILALEGQEFHTHWQARKEFPHWGLKTGPTTLEKILQVGPQIAASVKNFFDLKENQDILTRLRQAGVEVQEMPATEGTPLQGKTLVFTGSLANFTREEAKAQVEALGGRATSSVSSETDYVVVGANPGSKLDEARKQKVSIIDEKEFLELIGA
ncbi:MAG: hypothetical protein PHW74_11085 [Desulfobacca sp.]|nr:hypothetical protein [Desulfobacca sp.]